MAKVSINNLDAAAAIMKCTHMDYEVGSGFFLKTLLAKKYALPTQVINALVNFFLKFADDGVDFDEEDDDEDFEGMAGGEDGQKQMPVMWH